MSSLSLPSPRAAGHDVSALRLDLARGLGVAGVAAYNWWVVVPFVPGLMRSPDGFFSDLEATGERDALLMQHADLVAGVLLMAAFLLRGSRGRWGHRPEWKWMVAFAAAGAVGGEYPYACAEGLSASCRRLEWHLQLPVHHYVHVVSGIAEFAFLTTAVVVGVRRTRGQRSREATTFRVLLGTLVAAYPLLGLVYLTDRLGALVEPVFFIVFSAMVLAEVFEPAGAPAGDGARAVGAAAPAVAVDRRTPSRYRPGAAAVGGDPPTGTARAGHGRPRLGGLRTRGSERPPVPR